MQIRSAFYSIALLAVCGAVAPAAAQQVAGNGPAVQPSYMDRAVKPGDDFYQYACGTWHKNAAMPADRAEVTPGMDLDEAHTARLHQLILDTVKNGGPTGSGARKIADLYNSYMDEAAIDARGAKPLVPHLAAIAAIKNKRQLARALGQTLRADEDALNMTNFHSPNLFGLWVAPGFEDSDHYTPYLLQGGIMMPDREFYLSEAESMKAVRARYTAHVATVLRLAGFSDVEKRAEGIVALETAIAKVQWSLEDNNDIKKVNNPWKTAEFAVNAPGLDWSIYFAAAGLDRQKTFIVWQPSAIKGESALVASTPLDTWKDWLAFHVVESYSSVLPRAFADERFDFYGKVLGGVSEQTPRWKRGVGLVSGLLGDELGEIYVKKYFPPEVKAQVQAMVAGLIATYRTRLQGLTWMAPATKAEAIAKLDSLYVGVGYPETWHEATNYEVIPGDLFGDLWRSRLAYYQRQIARLGQPVDRKEWAMEPQTINALNLPLQNALNFPAAILQPPSFDANAPAAANWGAIGAVIGHEISHTFDSAGAAFDSKGRLRNWWTPEDFAHFEAETGKLAAQYDGYKIFPDLSLNGKQTLAENIADVAGLQAAFDAYRASLGGKPAPEQAGFDGDQQFFIAYAQAWATKLRDAALREEVLTDTHAPGPWRALTVRNLDAWYAAFGVQPGEKLYLAPADRVRIW